MMRTPVGRVATAIALLSCASSALGQSDGVASLVVPLVNDAKASAELDKVKSAVQKDEAQVVSTIPSESAKLVETSEQGEDNAQAVSIASQRVDSVEAALVGAANTGSRPGGSALSQLRTGFRQRPLDGFTVSPAGVTGDVAKLPGDKGLAAALVRASYLGTHLNVLRLGELPSSTALFVTSKGNAGVQEFAAHYEDFVGSLYGLLDAPSDSTRSSLENQATITRESFIENWRAFAQNPRARAIAVRSIEAIRGQPELKAVYAVQTSFIPASYQTIFETARRLAVVTDAAGTVLCSGLAITRQWVLTARHCVAHDLADLKVRLATDKGNLGTALTLKRRWPPADGTSSDAALDYTLLAVVPQPAGPDLPALCLRQRDAGFEEPLIAIGYAQGTELVYDAAYVWYPYSTLPKAFDRVAAMTVIRLHRLSEALPGSVNEREAFFQRELKSFQEAYSRSSGSGPDLKRFYQAPLTGGTYSHPRFGFDTDTRHGDSGAAVFSRRDNCVVGVFAGGRPDAATLSEANWMEHEFGTPITEVLADIDRRRPPIDPAVSPDAGLVELFAAIDSSRQ